MSRKKTKSQDVSDKREFSSFDILVTDKHLLLLLSVMVLGFVLRIHNLGSQSMWLDEAASFGYIQDTIIGTWEYSVNATKQAPLHMVVLHLMTYFSTSEFSLRLPSVIFGTLTIPVTYCMGVKLFGKNEGIISAFLVSISLMHIWYSQEARMYSQMLLFSSLSLYSFYVASNTDSRRNWILYIISSSLAFYSHYYAVFVFVPQVAYYLLYKVVIPAYGVKDISFINKDNVLNFIISMIVLFISTLPLMIPFLQQAISRTSGTPTWGIGQSIYFIPKILIEFSTRSNYSSIPYLLLFVAGVFIAIMKQKDQIAYLGLYLAIPLVISYLLAAKLPFSSRYLIFLLPAYLILVSRGITGVASLLIPTNKRSDNNNGQRTIIVCIMFLFFIINAPLISQYYNTVQKNDWRSLSPALENVTQEGDVIVPLPGYMNQPLTYYYSNSSDGTILYTSSGYNADSLSSISNNYTRAWFLVTGDINAVNPEGTALQWLQNNASYVGQITGIYVFTTPPVEG